VDKAIEQGLAQLGLTREQVEIEIIKEGRRGVFGIGAEDAQVRLTRRVIEPVVPVTVAPTLPPQPEFVVTKTSESPQPQSEPIPLSLEELQSQGAAFLQELLNQMGIKAQVTARIGTDFADEEESDSPVVLDITGRDLGILIGRHNATLRALEYMVRLAVNKHAEGHSPILVDVESYRVRRRRALQQLAERMAKQAVTTKRRVMLEPMSPYERRIIHLTLRNNSTVTTKSIGGDDTRRVTIIPK
jgi:spoIIIJ-associated protein